MTSQTKCVDVVVSAPSGETVTKNTRRRIQQKRTRNRRGCSGGGGGVGSGINETKKPTNPIIERKNPFFIAVCSPESYKPKTTCGSRRYNEKAISPIRTKQPNVFLRQPTTTTTTRYSPNGGNAMTNQFIHHPRIQNDRQQQNESSLTHVVEAVSTHNTMNLNDSEHFPSLSSASAVLQRPKLNFKEMIMKNTTTVSKPDSPSVPIIHPPPPPPPPPQLVQQKSLPQKSLSSGNIFLNAFYNTDAADAADDADDADAAEYEDNGGGGIIRNISSVLVDSCDRKYDKLYKY